MTRWVLGMRAWISRMRSMRSTCRRSAAGELWAPWLVPMAMPGRRRRCRLMTNSAASLDIGRPAAVVEHPRRRPSLPRRPCRFQRTQASDLALDRNADGVRHVVHAARDIHVVVVGRRLAVLAERAVHHHAGETELDGALADRGTGTVVLVHADRDVRNSRSPPDQVRRIGRRRTSGTRRSPWTITGLSVSLAASMMACICSRLA